MKVVCVLTAACLLAAPALAKPSIAKEKLDFAGAARTYYLYVPEGLAEKQPAPLLLTFHGSGRDGKSLVEKWTKLADANGFIVAGLDAKDSEGWAMPADGPDLVKALVDALQARYPIDGTRMYVFGHSAGAVFGLKLGLMESEYFAAVAVHAGSFRQADEYGVIRMATPRKIPFKIIVGDRDNFFPLSSVNATADALKAAGFAVDLEVVKRHDHWYYDRAQQFNESAWQFLKDQKLTSPPSYLQYRFQ
jgi:poly(3-hydroxybutyrate) depolymerase